MPENIEKPPEIDVAMLIKPPIELPEENVAAYLAGYLLHKLPVDECQVCSAELKISHLPPPSEGLSVYELLRKKNIPRSRLPDIPLSYHDQICVKS